MSKIQKKTKRGIYGILDKPIRVKATFYIHCCQIIAPHDTLLDVCISNIYLTKAQTLHLV